jgi:hypothetical protein
MKKTIISLASALVIALCSLSASAQTIVKDARGNYTAVKASKDSAKTADIATGKTFTDTKGNIWPVYQTKSGRVYALRTSKNGINYKQYLDTPKNK